MRYQPKIMRGLLMNILKIARVVVCLVVIAIAFGASGCSKVTSDVTEAYPSLEEATTVLNQAVAYSQARDMEGLGRLS
jgi:hypothetical protein